MAANQDNGKKTPLQHQEPIGGNSKGGVMMMKSALAVEAVWQNL